MTRYCRQKAVEIPDVAKFSFPTGLSKIMTVAISGTALDDRGSTCRHTLDIRDRHYDGGSAPRFWLQQGPIDERCTARHLLPVAGAILQTAYPTRRLGDIEGTITLTRDGISIVDLTTLLVQELPPYLTAKRVDIYYYATMDHRGDKYRPDKTFVGRW